MLTNGWLKVAYEGKYWDELSSFADEWVTSNAIQDYVTHYTANRPDKTIDDFEKHYIARLLPHDRKTVTYKASDSFLSFALQPTIVNFITKCMDGHQPTLQYYDLWHTFPLEEGRERIGSQGWHKDAEAFGKQSRVIKVFLYFSDCLEMGAGAFEMITDEGQLTFYMQRGDMLIADTGAWLHRGGYSTTKSRTYGVWVYNDSERILAKPRYNLTDEAREKFASPVLFEHRDWLIKKEKVIHHA